MTPNEMLAMIAQLRRERNQAREKIKRQAERIRELEGATNHACGTPLSVALRERDEAREKYTALATENMLAVNKLAEERDKTREDLEFRRGLYRVQEECLENAREQIKELIYIAGRAIDLADIDFENDKFGIVSELRSDLAKIKKSK